MVRICWSTSPSLGAADALTVRVVTRRSRLYNRQFTAMVRSPSFPVCASHILILLSSDPETMYLPSGENATDMTVSVWPSNGSETSFPVCASHILIVLSHDPAIVHHAPLIPAGMDPFHRNPQEWHWNPQEWAGIYRNRLEWHWNGLLEIKI